MPESIWTKQVGSQVGRIIGLVVLNAYWAFRQHRLAYSGFCCWWFEVFNPDYHSSYICRLDLGKERKGSFACRVGLSEAGLRSAVANTLMPEQGATRCS